MNNNLTRYLDNYKKLENRRPKYKLPMKSFKIFYLLNYY